jgi:hypothetical protein
MGSVSRAPTGIELSEELRMLRTNAPRAFPARSLAAAPGRYPRGIRPRRSSVMTGFGFLAVPSRQGTSRSFPTAIGDAARTAKIGQLSEALDRFEQCASDSVGAVGIVARDVLAEMSQMLDGSRRPDDGHTRGAFRSRLRPHERSQFATSLCGTPRPSSSSLRPV